MLTSPTTANTHRSWAVKPPRSAALTDTGKPYPDPVRILVTNDDGVRAPGLCVLAAALARLGEVSVVAPAVNWTAMGRAITITDSIEVDEVTLEDGRPAFSVDGTPTDCVRFALLGLTGSRPEIVVSGVNEGANLGDDVTYSGTVAAALEGIMGGIPALAVSQDRRRDRGGPPWSYDYTAACAFAAALAAAVAEHGLAPGTLLNVNVPGLDPGAVRGVRATRLGRRTYRTTLELDSSANGRRRYRLEGDDPIFHDEPGTDFTAVGEGCISVTPMHYDLTRHEAIESLAEWRLDDLLTAA
jgi:5'-nucleotidase